MENQCEPFHVCEYSGTWGNHSPTTEVSIINPKDSKKDVKVKALVDTGCTYALVIPKPLARSLKIEKLEFIKK